MSHTIRQFICLTQLESVMRSVGKTQGKDGVDVFHAKECDGWPLVKWLGTICLATCVICFLFFTLVFVFDCFLVVALFSVDVILRALDQLSLLTLIL